MLIISYIYSRFKLIMNKFRKTFNSTVSDFFIFNRHYFNRCVYRHVFLLFGRIVVFFKHFHSEFHTIISDYSVCFLLCLIYKWIRFDKRGCVCACNKRFNLSKGRTNNKDNNYEYFLTRWSIILLYSSEHIKHYFSQSSHWFMKLRYQILGAFVYEIKSSVDEYKVLRNNVRLYLKFSRAK